MSLRRLLFMLIFPYFLISAILCHRSVVFLRILHICAFLRPFLPESRR